MLFRRLFAELYRLPKRNGKTMEIISTENKIHTRVHENREGGSEMFNRLSDELSKILHSISRNVGSQWKLIERAHHHSKNRKKRFCFFFAAAALCSLSRNEMACTFFISLSPLVDYANTLFTLILRA